MKADKYILIRRYISENPYVGNSKIPMPNLKLARIIYKENPLSFKDIDNVRSLIRMVKGKHGEAAKRHVADKSLFNTEAGVKNPYNLPPSDEEEFKPYVIKGHTKGLVINDLHIPYHSIEALTATIKFGIKYKPDFIFVNGDLIDSHQLSHFLRDPKKKHFAEELKIASDFLHTLKKTFKCKIYFKFGNHERRYDNFLFQKAKELVGVEEFELEHIFKIRVPDIEIIKDKRVVVIAGLPFVHGDEFGRGVFSPVNAARGLFLQAKHSCVKADCHTTSEHNEPNIFRKLMTTYSVGSLCGLTPQWLPLNKWNHGFATIDCLSPSTYNFRNYRIQDGIIL